MNAHTTLRLGVARMALGAVAMTAAVGSVPGSEGESTQIQNGKIGFVVADITYALTNTTDINVTCPEGVSLGPRDIFSATPEGHRRAGESDADYSRRVTAGGNAVLTAPNGQNLCMNPEAGKPDPNYHNMTNAQIVVVDGIDLDGQDSTAKGRAAPGTCAHDDFRGVHGEHGIDNQFFRAVGCTNTFGPGGQANTFAQFGTLVGEWGILISLEDVQDLRNDDSVVVHFYANNDPMALSPNREPLVYATYAIEQNPRYQATTRGRIVNGVLTTEPVDVRFHHVVAGFRLDRPLQDARMRMTIAADGSMNGILAGYAPVEGIYDTVVGFRDGRDAQGQLARGREGSASGYAMNGRHTCNGVYYALRQMADGHRDPTTGVCNSISMQYLVRAVPAFIVNAQTRSANSDLVEQR